MEQPKIGEYTIIEKLESGNFGIVYLVKNKDQKAFALKSIEDEQSIQMAKKQVSLYEKIFHPNVVRLHESFFYQNGKCLAIVLEYCPEGDLAKYIKDKKVTKQNQIDFIKQIAEALVYLHKNQIIHRDIKPENILIQKDTVKICDFSSSKILKTSRMNTNRQGTEYYMSPQILESEHYDFQVDVWSFGILCFQILTGKRIMKAYEGRLLPALSENFPSQKMLTDIENEKMKDLVRKMLVKDPKLRLTSEQVLKIVSGNSQVQAQKFQDSQSQYKFSKVFKGKSIELTQNDSKATNPSLKLTDQLVYVNENLSKGSKRIAFKIEKNGCAIAVGMAIKSVVEFNSAHFQPQFTSYTSHGCFVISNSGFSYCHDNYDQNKVRTDFKFNEGDAIKLETDNNFLYFSNETTQKKHKMKLKLSEKEFKQLFFCVYLSGRQDSVLIL